MERVNKKFEITVNKLKSLSEDFIEKFLFKIEEWMKKYDDYSG